MEDKDILLPIDPDINIFNSSMSSSSILSTSSQTPLLSPSSLNSNISLTNFNFSMLHFNIRSLFNKMDQLSIFLNEFNTSFPVIGLTETWLDEVSSSLISLPNYNFVYANRQNKIGGGVGLFISSAFNFTIRKDLCPINQNFDWLAVEVFSKTSPNLIIFVVYRPPNTDPSIFTNCLTISLNHISLKNKLIYIMGDFNINILNNDTNNISANFSNLMSSLNLIPLITHPTRITTYSSTLIDNIYTNNLQSHHSAVLINDLSDHFPICTLFKSDIKPIPRLNQYKYSFTKSNISALNNFLANYDWNIVLNSNDVNFVSSRFIEIIHHGLNLHCTSKIKHCKKRKQPWLTLGLLKSSSVKKNYTKNMSNVLSKIINLLSLATKIILILFAKLPNKIILTINF